MYRKLKGTFQKITLTTSTNTQAFHLDIFPANKVNGWPKYRGFLKFSLSFKQNYAV